MKSFLRCVWGCVCLIACKPPSSSDLGLGDVAGDDTFAVAASVTGLLGSGLILQLNGAADLAIDQNGEFTFVTQVDDGAEYQVSVARAPVLPSQTCVVARATGQIAAAAVSVAVDCTIDRFAVGGLVSGLATSGLVLSFGGELLPVAQDGAFAFATAIDDLSDYSVAVAAQPTGQLCEASAARGKVNGRAVDTVRIACKALVLPVFSNAPGWNDYVQAGASDSACGADIATSYASCLHGGEMRSLAVYGRTSCVGLSASDALGAFDWQCEAGDPVRFVSKRLAPGKRLRDLIDVTARIFKPNSVTVTEGAVAVAVSASNAWWSTPIKDAATTTLDEAGTIFLLGNDGAYAVSADRVAAIATSNAGLAPTADVTALVTVASRDFVWIEGKLVAKRSSEDANHGVLVQSARFVVLRGVSVDNAAVSGVAVSGGGASALFDVLVTNSAIGVSLDNAFGLLCERVTTVSSTGDGLHVSAISDSHLYDLQAVNGGGSGLSLQDTTRSTFGSVRVSNNAQHGVQLVTSHHNRFTGVTSTSNTDASVSLSGSNGNWMLGLTAALSGSGISAQTSTGNRVMQAVFAGNTAAVICSSGALTIADHASDLASYGDNGGVCTLTLSGPMAVSAATLQASFVGHASSDAINASDAAGIAEHTKLQLSPGLAGWYIFSNGQRAWGLSVAANAFLGASQRGVCAAPDTCRILDWSLAPTDTQLRGVLATPTALDATTHEWTGATVGECDAIAGAVFGSTCTSTFFPHAIELLQDGVGNDNGLCEPSEPCLAAPNIASHQGSAATFVL